MNQEHVITTDALVIGSGMGGHDHRVLAGT